MVLLQCFDLEKTNDNQNVTDKIQSMQPQQCLPQKKELY